MAVNVLPGNGYTESLSRTSILLWVNKTLNIKLKKIEELCTGAHYCQFMDMLFPGSVSMKRVKFKANKEIEYIHNFKILQTAFDKVGVDRSFPVDKIVQGKFQDNYNFLLWFKRFYDANVNREIIFHEEEKESNPTCKRRQKIPPRTAPTKTKTSLESQKLSSAPKASSSAHSISLSSKNLGKTKANKVKQSTECLSQINDSVKNIQDERDFYFEKLIEIEILCLKHVESIPFLNEVLDVLYATKDTYFSPNYAVNEEGEDNKAVSLHSASSCDVTSSNDPATIS